MNIQTTPLTKNIFYGILALIRSGTIPTKRQTMRKQATQSEKAHRRERANGNRMTKDSFYREPVFREERPSLAAWHVMVRPLFSLCERRSPVDNPKTGEGVERA